MSAPSGPPPRSLAFTISSISLSNGFRTCNVVVSNVSDYSVEAGGGSDTLWFEIAYLTNEVWQYSHVHTVDGGLAYMAAHSAERKNLIKIPDTATALKVGLNFTSLTWRGQLAFRIAGGPFGGRVLRTVTGFLLLQDEKRRTKTEWSDEFHLVETNSVTANAAPR